MSGQLDCVENKIGPRSGGQIPSQILLFYFLSLEFKISLFLILFLDPIKYSQACEYGVGFLMVGLATSFSWVGHPQTAALAILGWGY